MATVIKLRFIANEKEKTAARFAWRKPAHENCTVLMFDAGLCGGLMLDRSQNRIRLVTFVHIEIQTTLYNLNLVIRVCLVTQGNYAKKNLSQ